jgi:hypothetical protein
MSYEGDYLNACGAIAIDLSAIDVVLVSGASWNPCDHLILFAGPRRGGYYFHVAGSVHDFPKYMDEAGYRRYLKENGKVELRRLPLSLPKPQEALLFLEGLMANKWFWKGLPDNCVSFVEDVIASGGGTWSSASNCPSVATAETITQRIERFVAQLQGEIYRAYGVPYY